MQLHATSGFESHDPPESNYASFATAKILSDRIILIPEHGREPPRELIFRKAGRDVPPIVCNRINRLNHGAQPFRYTRSIAIAMPIPPPTQSDAMPRRSFKSSKM